MIPDLLFYIFPVASGMRARVRENTLWVKFGRPEMALFLKKSSRISTGPMKTLNSISHCLYEYFPIDIRIRAKKCGPRHFYFINWWNSIRVKQRNPLWILAILIQGGIWRRQWIFPSPIRGCMFYKDCEWELFALTPRVYSCCCFTNKDDVSPSTTTESTS